MTSLTKMIRLGAAALVAGTALLGVADISAAEEAEGRAAAASADVTVKTTDANPGGVGKFVAYGEHLKACDMQTDGYNVTTGIYYDGHWHFDKLLTDSTVDGVCRDLDLNIAEGAYVKIQVCLQSANTGRFAYCSAEKSGRA